jgi:hypothetical protein
MFTLPPTWRTDAREITEPKLAQYVNAALREAGR